MTWVIPPLVTEHEPGPDYNCVPCSGLMQYLATNPGAAPATLEEAKAIRLAAGIALTGPMNSLNLIVGERNRYHWQPAEIPRGAASILASLTPGHSATASGIPTDAPSGSPFRHWLPSYAGGHRVYVARMDALPRVWLLDPEAPAGFAGEWASLTDLAAFVRNGSSHTVAPLAQGGDVLAVQDNTLLPAPNPRNFTITPNAVVNGYSPAAPGQVVKTYHGPTPPVPFGTVDASVSVGYPGTANPPIPRGSGFSRVVSGYFAGLLVPTAQLTLEPATPSGIIPVALAPGVYEVQP